MHADTRTIIFDVSRKPAYLRLQSVRIRPFCQYLPRRRDHILPSCKHSTSPAFEHVSMAPFGCETALAFPFRFRIQIQRPLPSMPPERKAVKENDSAAKKKKKLKVNGDESGKPAKATETSPTKTAATRARLPRAAKDASAEKPSALEAASGRKPKITAAKTVEKPPMASKKTIKIKLTSEDNGPIDDTKAAQREKPKPKPKPNTATSTKTAPKNPKRNDRKPAWPENPTPTPTPTSPTMTTTNPLLFLTPQNFPFPPPITTNSIKNFDPTTIASDAKSTTIITHPRYPALVTAFLPHKRIYGSRFEKALYTETWTWQDQVRRLILKRPLVFVSCTDSTMLRNGRNLANSRVEWDKNGTWEQGANVKLGLKEYLSYDEVMLGSLLGVSGASLFINEGDRGNCGRMGRKGSFEPRGVIVELVGARFEREDRMGSVFMLADVREPRMHGELRAIYQEWFGVGKTVGKAGGFDIEMYKARTRVTVDLFLLEANRRARLDGRKAWAYVVGLGLGVWQTSSQQPKYYVDTFTDAIRELDVSNIGTLEFAYITVSKATIDAVTKAGKAKGIEVMFSKRNPAAKLDKDELLVLSYAWDGNSFPGKEHWQGALSASGDPAAACMSTIGELHNPYINPYMDHIEVLDDKPAKTKNSPKKH